MRRTRTRSSQCKGRGTQPTTAHGRSRRGSDRAGGASARVRVFHRGAREGQERHKPHRRRRRRHAACRRAPPRQHGLHTHVARRSRCTSVASEGAHAAWCAMACARRVVRRARLRSAAARSDTRLGRVIVRVGIVRSRRRERRRVRPAARFDGAEVEGMTHAEPRQTGRPEPKRHLQQTNNPARHAGGAGRALGWVGRPQLLARLRPAHVHRTGSCCWARLRHRRRRAWAAT